MINQILVRDHVLWQREDGFWREKACSIAFRTFIYSSKYMGGVSYSFEEGVGKGAFCLKSRATNTTICSMERILSLSESNLLGK